MENKKLIVCFKEDTNPAQVMSMAVADTGMKFQRLYDIEKDVDSFTEKNMDKVNLYSNDEELFSNEIYPGKSAIEKRMYQTFKVDCGSEEEASSLYRLLQASEDVAYVQYDELNELYDQDVSGKCDSGPNDEFLKQQWAIAKISGENAWNLLSDEAIVVAVIDTGVDYTHPDISANMWVGPEGTKHGRNFSENNDDPIDYHGHGTHVAGTIAATANNSIGIAGVAPYAKIMALRIFPNAFDSVCAQAIRYAVDNGARVLNNSWGPTGRKPSNQVVEDAIAYAYSKGAVVVFAAGNNNDEVQYYSPANHPDVISVGATDRDDARADFSNYGQLVSIAAPGVDILSLEMGTGKYISMSGTSMAAPHVAGLAALVLQSNTKWLPGTVKKYIQDKADAIITDRAIGNLRINVENCIP